MEAGSLQVLLVFAFLLVVSFVVGLFVPTGNWKNNIEINISLRRSHFFNTMKIPRCIVDCL